jgi:GrpB-like predicted nucleotidyltransferase (UPF0157 family)
MTPQSPMAFNSTLQTMEDPILVVDYDVDWPLQYEQEKSHILDALSNTIADIQHIGSTSVPGLAAKPVIDILLGVEQMPPQTSQIAGLETLGYLYCGELGIPGRHYFRRGMPRTHQIHLVKLNSEFWETHVLFRDFLRTHPNAAQQYEALKRDLAVKFRADRERYTDSKTPLIEQLLVQARAWRSTCSTVNLPRKNLE